MERTTLYRCLYLAMLCNLGLQSAEPDEWKQAIDRAERLHEEGKFTEARTILLGALEDASKHPNREHRLANTLDILGSVAQDEGRYFEAEEHYRRAISYWQAGGERSLVGLGRTLNNLASLLNSADKLREAQELLRQSEAIQVERLGWHHPEVGAVLRNRGVVYLKQRRYREAEEVYRRAWAVLEPHAESRELDLVRVAADLGVICEKTGRKEEAYSHYAFARTVLEKHVQSGRVTPETLRNLAAVYLIFGQDLPAKLMLEEGLVLAERVLGPRDPRLADMLFMYARVLRQTGRKSESVRVAKQAKAIVTHSEERLAQHTISVSDLVPRQRTR